MKKKLVFGASAICLSLGFWACGDGSIESIGADDDIARAFALDDEGLKELMKAAEKDCEADESCKSAQNDAYKSADDDDEDEESSDSDSGDSSASSSGSTAVSSSNVVVSSSGMVLSSSGAVVTSSAGATSSAGGTSSAQVTPVSSSSGPQITPASSSAVSSSSAAPATGKTVGICQLSSKTIEKGESATWSFVKTQGAKDETYKWTFTDGSTSTEAKPSKTYSQAGEFSAKVLINAGKESENEIDCSAPPVGNPTVLKVNGTPITGCKCSSDAEALFFASGKPATATWTASGCTGGNTFTYTWGGDATGSGTSATGSFEKSGSFTPTLSVSNEEGMTMSATCPSVTVSQVLSASCNVGDNSNGVNQQSVSVMPGQTFYFKPTSISGFPSGASRVSAKLIGGGSETEISISKNDWENSATSVTAPMELNTYTYTLSANGIDICTASLTVEYPQITAGCSFKSATIPGKPAKFNISNLSGWKDAMGGSVPMILKSGSASDSITVGRYSNGDFSIDGWESVGEYDYVLEYEGAKVCEATMVVDSVVSTGCKLTSNWNQSEWKFVPGSFSPGWDGGALTMTIVSPDAKEAEVSVNNGYNGGFVVAVPTEPGDYDYVLKYAGHEVCTVTHVVEASEE